MKDFDIELETLLIIRNILEFEATISSFIIKISIVQWYHLGVNIYPIMV